MTASCSKPLFLSELRDVLVKPLQAREEKGTSKTAVDFTGKKILLAEDNEMNQMIAEAILTEAGFSLNIACDGNIAVQMMMPSASCPNQSRSPLPLPSSAKTRWLRGWR